MVTPLTYSALNNFRAKIKAAIRPPFLRNSIFLYLFLQHFDAINVNLVAVYFPAHGNMMSVMPFKGIWIIHHQNFLISIGDDDRAAPALMHFSVHAAPSALASLAPHLELLTHPFTVPASLANDIEATDMITAPATNKRIISACHPPKFVLNCVQL